LSPEQHTTKTLINSQKFIIHLLAKHQMDLVPIFGLYTSKDYDKFASVNFKEDEDGLPIIEQTCGWAKCHLLSKMGSGDRIVILAEVEKEEFYEDKEPLVLDEVFNNLPPHIIEQLNDKYRKDIERDRRLIMSVDQ
ncbi:flavin reductase family protein, partial [Acidobacteria bacterium AH-259-O06]|nr:flavin reductase family protein [Acidobacteria bacterium AH-259-O06]